MKPRVIEPQVYEDDRGYFKETYNVTKFEELGLGAMQCNQAVSDRGVIRGLHFQSPAVGKLVWVVKGSIYDVCFNLQTGEYMSQTLSDENHKQMWCPPGYAHGFQALEDDTRVVYLMDGVFNPEGDDGINPMIVDWPIKEVILSEKDKNAAEFSR